MKTLKQIIAQKGKIVHAVNPNYMTENDYIQCFKEWLQQKQNNVASRNPTVARDTYSFINELLEEFKGGN